MAQERLQASSTSLLAASNSSPSHLRYCTTVATLRLDVQSMTLRPRLQPLRTACRGTIRRRSSISGPYLLDQHIPRYQLLTSVQEAKKRSLAYAHLRECNLCPRLCGVNRYEKTGTCLIGSNVVVNTIAPHFAEEPCISGRNGSGSVFFSGCNLRCN